MELSRLWVAMLTRYLSNAGTDSGITLRIVIGGEEKLDETLSNALQNNRGAGVANLYEVNVAGKNIIPEELEPSSISIIIRGRDAWRPEHLVVWGERREFLIGSEAEIIPLAIETDITTQISADASEGPSSLTLRSVDTGRRNMQINRLFMLMTTAGTQQESSNPINWGGPSQTTGTDSPLQIQIVSEGHLVVLSEISDTTQDDLQPGSANFYSAPVIAPFPRGSLDDRSITLRILSSRSTLEDMSVTIKVLVGG